VTILPLKVECENGNMPLETCGFALHETSIAYTINNPKSFSDTGHAAMPHLRGASCLETEAGDMNSACLDCGKREQKEIGFVASRFTLLVLGQYGAHCLHHTT
jgi:hypothetical protein